MITSFGTNYPISMWIYFFFLFFIGKISLLGFDTTPWSITYFSPIVSTTETNFVTFSMDQSHCIDPDFQ